MDKNWINLLFIIAYIREIKQYILIYTRVRLLLFNIVLRFLHAVTCSYRLFISVSMPFKFIYSSVDGHLGNSNCCCYECSGSFTVFRASSSLMCSMTVLSKIIPIKDYFECICNIIIITPLLMLI